MSDRLGKIAAAARAAKPAGGTYLLVVSENEPGGRRFVTLPDASVLAWFRRNWNRTDVQRTDELRGHVYGLESVFDNVTGPPPGSDADLIAWIDRTIYAEQDHVVRPHYLKVETDDDEVPIRYYFFDNAFLAEPGAWNDLPHPRDGHDDDDDDERRPDAFEKFVQARMKR